MRTVCLPLLDEDESREHSLPPVVALPRNLSIVFYSGGGVARSYAVVRIRGRPAVVLPAADA
jgi:hypothetical protein